MKLEVKLKTGLSAEIAYIQADERYVRRSGHICKTIGQVLRGAYRLDDFEKSQIYERLTNYSANTGVRLLRMNQSRTFV